MSNSEQQRVAMIQLNYPPGTRIVLDHMDDPYAPVESGSRGSVQAVDDAGQIHMAWDNGRTLAVIPGVDTFRKLTPQELTQLQELIRKSSNTPVLHDKAKSEGSVTYAAPKEKKEGESGIRKSGTERRGINSYRKV